MLKAENINIILDGKTLKNLRGFKMEADGSMFHPEVLLTYYDQGLERDTSVHTILVGVESNKRNLLSKKEESISFLTLICKTAGI